LWHAVCCERRKKNSFENNWIRSIYLMASRDYY
jgi:hypothetical protein